MFEKLAGISKRAIEHDAKTGRIFIIPEALHDFDSAVRKITRLSEQAPKWILVQLVP